MAPSVEPCALQVGHLAGHMACYPYDLDEATQRQLARGSLIREFMKQAPGQPYSVVQQVALISNFSLGWRQPYSRVQLLCAKGIYPAVATSTMLQPWMCEGRAVNWVRSQPRWSGMTLFTSPTPDRYGMLPVISYVRLSLAEGTLYSSRVHKAYDGSAIQSPSS